MIIVFEGLDKSGKSTGIKYAEDYLSHYNFKVKTISEIGDNAYGLGKMLKDIMKNISISDTAQFYLMSAIRTENKKDLEELSKDYVILLDRYYLSTMVYQSNVEKYLKSSTLIKSLYNIIISNTIVKIDGVMYFDAPVEEIRRRLNNTKSLDNLEYKISKNLESYKQLYEEALKTIPKIIPVVRINTMYNKIEVEKNIREGIDLILRHG